VRDLSIRAMLFARDVHSSQRRKYTGVPYFDHLAEVAGIAMSVGWHDVEVHPDQFMAVCWLHDVSEDCGISNGDILKHFDPVVAEGVAWLTDAEQGNRAERKAASRQRLARAPGWVQTIKCADLISNTGSIVDHDPSFAKVYLAEKVELLKVMTKADTRLHTLASSTAAAGMRRLEHAAMGAIVAMSAAGMPPRGAPA
jgi:guanosine-3',5'-bis(diphosphate) 3'-pyrophosphohydrolase